MTKEELDKIFLKRDEVSKNDIKYVIGPTINPNLYLKKSNFFQIYNSIKHFDGWNYPTGSEFFWIPIKAVENLEEAVFYLWVYHSLDQCEYDNIEEFVNYDFPDDHKFPVFWGSSSIRDFITEKITIDSFIQWAFMWAEVLVSEEAVSKTDFDNILNGEKVVEVYKLLSLSGYNYYIGYTENYYFTANAGIWD